jgi:hypothetical protein
MIETMMLFWFVWPMCALAADISVFFKQSPPVKRSLSQVGQTNTGFEFLSSPRACAKASQGRSPFVRPLDHHIPVSFPEVKRLSRDVSDLLTHLKPDASR